MRTRVLVVALCSLFVLSAAHAGGGFQTDLAGQLQYVQKQVLELENAIPDAKMTWRPAKGVRSVSEVYAHIAGANYMIGQMAGFKLPEGVTLPPPADAAKWESSTTDKKELAARLTKSFEFLTASVKGVSDADLERTVEFFGNKMTVRGLLMICLSHIHEHLGQSIAYARMVGVVPPWTAAREGGMKEK
jgi:uncharacterized damage-inducible protein DinB